MTSLFDAMKSLGEATRFRIVETLLVHPACVTFLAKHLGISESAVSQHLKILREAGLVRGEKRGYWTHYSVDRDALKQVGHELESMASVPERPCCGSGGSLVQNNADQQRKELPENV